MPRERGVGLENESSAPGCRSGSRQPLVYFVKESCVADSQRQSFASVTLQSNDSVAAICQLCSLGTATLEPDAPVSSQSIALPQSPNSL